MKMSTDLVKKGSVGLQDLRHDFTDEENAQALRDLKAEILYRPMNGMVPERLAGAAKQLLDLGFTELSPLRRGQAYKICALLISGEHWDLSVTAVCSKLGISRPIYYNITQKWPYLHHLVNLFIVEIIMPAKMGNIVHATAEAATHGNDRDRRLYFELFGGLKQKGGERGPAQIVFIQDSMERPTPDVIDVTPSDED